MEFADTSTVPIDVGKDFGTLRVFWRYRYKVRFLVIQDSLGIEHEIRETDLNELDTENPSLNERFVAELVSMLEGKSKKEQVELKRNVCTSLNIREHTLREAIRRYRRRMSNKDSVLSIDTNNYNIKYDITTGDGSLDDSDYKFISELVNNMKTVPMRYRHIKLKRAYAAIGMHFKYDFDKWIEIFDYECSRQLKKVC